MLTWKTPSMDDLTDVVRAATDSLHFCSPFITRPGIDALADALPEGIPRVEIWTKFDARDWITGASEPDGLLDFIESLPTSTDVHLRVSDRLHAKFVVANNEIGMAGSSNLTRGGFGGNIEIVRLVGPNDIQELLAYIQSVRYELLPADLEELREFVSICQSQAHEKEALLDLIRGAIPQHETEPASIRSISEFMQFLGSQSGEVVDTIRTIYFNLDGNNRTGHLKQGYYAVQRFLQEHPAYLATLSEIPLDEAFNLREQPIYQDWLNFFRSTNEVDGTFAYDFSVLRRYLTPSYGGHRTGGGGGDYPFRLVWGPVARLMSQ